jgi:plastocyanin
MSVFRQLVRPAASAASAAIGSTVLLAGGAQGAASKTVHIKGIDFSPRVLTVKPGTTVRWMFEDKNTPHNVTSRGRMKFRSSPTKQSGSYAFRFTKHGRYAYVCTIHLNMKGTIVV